MKTPYLSSAEGRQLVEDWQASGLSQKAYCSGKGISYSRFHYWYAVYRSDLKPAATFLPVQVAPLEDHVIVRGSNGLQLQLSVSAASAVFIKQLLTA
ncbi:MAG: hypothetical protein V4722_08340 [Bacteroidota bacterium]